MTNIGYPDFQEQAQWQSLVIASASQVVPINSSSSLGPTAPCAQWSNIQMDIHATGGPVDIYVNWISALGLGAVGMGLRAFTVGPGQEGIVTFPNLGPVVSLSANTGGTGPVTVDYTLSFSNRIQPMFAPSNFGLVAGQFGILMSVDNVVIAPAGTLTTTFNFPYGGPAYVNVVSPNNAAWFANINVNPVMVGSQLAAGFAGQAWYGNGSEVHQQIILPPGLCSMQLGNQSGVNQTFYAHVIADLWRH